MKTSVVTNCFSSINKSFLKKHKKKQSYPRQIHDLKYYKIIMQFKNINSAIGTHIFLIPGCPLICYMLFNVHLAYYYT